MIELVRLPEQVDAVEVTVRAGGRSFQERLPRPADDRITEFSAVPAGPAELDVRAFAGEQIVAARVAIELQIVENETQSVRINFVDDPEFDIREPPAEEPHRLKGASFIPVEIELANPGLGIELVARANGLEVALAESGGRYFGTIDPAIAGEILPASIELEVTACLSGSTVDCLEKTRSIVVTRAAWRRTVAEESASRPVRFEDGLLLADGAGTLHAITSTGGDRFAAVPLGAVVREDIAMNGGTAYVTTRDERTLVVELGGAAALRSHSLGATSAPVAGPGGVIVAADRALIAVDGERTIATLPRRVRAPPLWDQDGIVAVDIVGNVQALDAAEAPLFAASVASPVFAAPVRYRGRVVISTSAGEIVQLDGTGNEALPRVALGRPVVHAPVVIGERLIAAADDRVFFIEEDRVVAQVAAGATITGGPAPWKDRVVVGLQNGLVRAVDENGSRPIERVAGAAFGPLVLDDRIVVVGSSGDLAMLEPEEGF